MNTLNNIILYDDYLESYVEKAKQGDKAAFTQLVQSAMNTVSSIALAITKDVNDSHDVTQQVFIKMWQQLDQLKNAQSLMPWLRQITRYTAYNFIRDNKASSKEYKDEQELELLLQQVCEQVPTQDESLIKQQQAKLIRELIDQLPDESREIVVLYYREELNSANVSALLGISEANIRKKLQRAREFLKHNLLQKYGKTLFATTPISMAALFASTAMTSSPVAASTLAYSATSSNGSWLAKLFSGLGGALIGGIIALFANTFAMNYVMKHIDNAEDMEALKRIKSRSNILIVITCVLFSLSYSFSDGWLFPLLTYLMFLAGLVVHITAANKISFANLGRKAEYDEKAAKQLRRDRWSSKLGWVLGVGGGTFGLLYGLYTSGRFAQLW